MGGGIILFSLVPPPPFLANLRFINLMSPTYSLCSFSFRLFHLCLSIY